MKNICRLSLVLVFILVPMTIYAQGDSYTTEGGLSFSYPDGWRVEEFAGIVVIQGPGDAFAQIIANTPAGFTDELGIDASSVEVLADVFMQDAQVSFTSSQVEVSGQTAIRLDGGDDTTAVMAYVFPLGDQFVVFTGFTAADEMADYESIFLDMVNSMRYDPNATPSSLGPIDSTLVSGEGVLVWQSQIPVESGPTGIQTIIDGAIGPAGAIFATDGLKFYEVDAGGNFIAVVRPSEFMLMIQMEVAPDGSFWVSDLEGLVRVDVDGAVQGLFGGQGDPEGQRFGLAGPENMVMGPDGNIYAYTTYLDDVANPEGYVQVWNTAGEFVRRFMVSEAQDGMLRFIAGVVMAFNPDGNLLLVDDTGATKLVDMAGNVLDAAPYDLGPNFFAVRDIVFGSEGTLYVLNEGVIYRYDASGTFMGQFGTYKPFTDNESMFEAGEFSDNARMDTTNDGKIVVFDGNDAYNQVVLLDFDRQ